MLSRNLKSAFKTTGLDVAGGFLGTNREAKKNFVSQGTLDTIDQSGRARPNSRAELFRELKQKLYMCKVWTRRPMCRESVRG